MEPPEGAAKVDAALNGWGDEHAAVVREMESQVLEQQARSAGAIFMRSLGGKLGRARPNPRALSAAQLEAASAPAAVNAPPPRLTVGTETQCMVVRGKGDVAIEAPDGLEVRATTSRFDAGQVRAQPHLRNCALVSFVLVPSLNDPFDTALYGKHRRIVVSVGGRPLDGSPFEVELSPSPEYQAPSTIEVVDGQSNEDLAHTAITFRDRHGKAYRFAPGERVRLPSDGAYDVTVCSDAEFTPLWRRAIVSMGQLRSGAPTRLMMSARLTHHNQLRAILSWRETPRDLDLHVFQRHASSRRLAHVYYPRKGRTIEGMHLDVDVTTGHGPETVTIDVQPRSHYLFAVHNYSDDGAICESGARIELYDSSGLLEAFEVPSVGTGRWWKAFSLSGAAWQDSGNAVGDADGDGNGDGDGDGDGNRNGAASRGVRQHDSIGQVCPSKQHFAAPHLGLLSAPLRAIALGAAVGGPEDAPSTLSGLVIHPDVGCGRCGQAPIVGSRFCDAEAHRDLCRGCYEALPTEQAKSGFVEIKAPAARSMQQRQEWEHGHGPNGETLGAHKRGDVECFGDDEGDDVE